MPKRLLKRSIALRALFSRPPENERLDAGASSRNQPTPPTQPKIEPTYQSFQQTVCAGCGCLKHTPLRRDEMGGYVCLTCIDKRLDQMEDERTLDSENVQEHTTPRNEA